MTLSDVIDNAPFFALAALMIGVAYSWYTGHDGRRDSGGDASLRGDSDGGGDGGGD